MSALIEVFIMYIVLPTWIAAGVADWWTHRRSRIQETSGWLESFLHIALVVQMGIPIIAALFLDINAAFFILTGVSLVIHQITIYIDLKYASSRRYISPLEQMIHGAQEGIPYAATMLLAVLYWEQFTAIFGLGKVSPVYTFIIKENLPSLNYILGVLIAGAAVLLLFIEELIRCWRRSKVT